MSVPLVLVCAFSVAGALADAFFSAQKCGVFISKPRRRQVRSVLAFCHHTGSSAATRFTMYRNRAARASAVTPCVYAYTVLTPFFACTYNWRFASFHVAV